MTNEDIDKIAARVAELVLAGILQSDLVPYSEESEEQALLAELAQAMTQLDYNLQKENYAKCEKLKKKILEIENKLNKYK